MGYPGSHRPPRLGAPGWEEEGLRPPPSVQDRGMGAGGLRRSGGDGQQLPSGRVPAGD